MSMLDFGVPPARVARALWELYVRIALPTAGRLLSPGWHDVGRFLGPSIRHLEARLPLERQLELWSEAGLADVRARRLSLGGGVVVWGRRGERPAAPGLLCAGTGRLARLRDAAHLPYTLWHLSYVAIGAALAPRLRGQPLLWGARGVPARPRRRCPRTRRVAQPPAGHGDPARPAPGSPPCPSSPRSRSESGPRSRGRSGPPFVAAGAFLVPAYTLELGRGRPHTDLWFGLAWGAFPVLFAYLGGPRRCGPRRSSRLRSRCSPSLAQRSLSTQVRTVRRRVADVTLGRSATATGTKSRSTRKTLARAPEAALQSLSLAMVALAVALVWLRLG